MIAVIDAIEVNDQFVQNNPLQGLIVDTFHCICSLLEVYVEKGNLKSRHHLARKALFECMVSKVLYSTLYLILLHVDW